MKALSTAFCAMCAVFGLTVSATAADVTLTWDASATPATLGDAETGLLSFTYVDGKVKTLTVTPVDGGTIVLTGDTIAFAAAATNFMAAAGELVFSNAVTGAGNLVTALKSNDAIERYRDYEGDNITTNYSTVFTNCRLEDWMPFSTGNIGGKGWWQADNIKTYNIRHETDGTITAQRQSYLDGNTKIMVGVAKFQLKQVGDDIACRILYAGYWRQQGGLGGDGDAVIANPETYGEFVNQGVSTPTVDSGYGFKKMRIYRVGGLPTVRFAGGLNTEGRLIATAFTHVVLERARTGLVKGCYSAFTNGILTFRDPVYDFDPSVNEAVSAALADGLTGSGTVVFEATDTLFGDETLNNPTYTAWLPSNRWVTVAYNQQLSAMTNVMAYFDGNGMNGVYKNKLEPIQFLEKNADNTYATAQFHHKGGWSSSAPDKTLCVLVEFQQNGNDIQMRGRGVAVYNSISAYGTRKLSVDGTLLYTTNSAASHYGVHDITPMFPSAKPVKRMTMRRYPGIRSMGGSTDAPGCKAQLIIKGTDNVKMRYWPAAANGHVMPATEGLMRIQNGGEVIQTMTGRESTSAMWVGDTGLVYIEDGGVCRQQSNWGVGVTQRVDIAGGEYRVRDIVSVNPGQCALNLLTFSGDVQLHSDESGDYVCAGATNGAVNAIWTVRGTSASTCDVPLRLWSAPSGGKMTFAVNDVAAGSDFIMNGAIDADANFANTTVYKTGPGTIQLNAAYDIGGKPTIITNGTWLLNGSSLTSAADPYTLTGGTLAAAEGTANSLGILTVGANGGNITLGAGATLSFADSRSAAWGDGENVVITGFAEGAIRFGTTKDGLTDAQRKRLRTSAGKPLYINSQGYLTRIVGACVVVR